MREWLRDHGLTLAMLGSFAVFLVAQSVTGMRSYNQDRREHGEATVGYVAYLATGHFVEATFENWQSEFLAVASLAWLSIFLRQRGSPESKPVWAPHRQTGEWAKDLAHIADTVGTFE